MPNIIFKTDSYKLDHWEQYIKGTQVVESYFEARNGAKYPMTVWFGLQAILKKNCVGQVVTREKIEQAAALSRAHFGNEKRFNRAGWEYILEKFDGRLPITIKAVLEGTVVPINNIMMKVRNNGGEPTAFLTNAIESLLTHVWYPSTVATLSYSVKQVIHSYLKKTAENDGGLRFMLHDFGYRGVSSDESAEFGGAGHLVNFLGTDTVSAMQFIVDYYHGNPNYEGIAYSVPATEHSVMTGLGRAGEHMIVENLLNHYPEGILSVVADSYDYYNFVENFVGVIFKERILARNGVFVIRPDSVTPEHPTPESLMVWTMQSLWKTIGGTTNKKGFKVINAKVRVLWGDGINAEGIEKILAAVTEAGFSVENIATFGMGGGLLQKVNRDTQRFAFKCCWQQRDGIGYDIYKEPLDKSKASKRGQLKLVVQEGAHANTLVTVPISDPRPDVMQTIFENGELLVDSTFDEIRKRAEEVYPPYSV